MNQVKKFLFGLLALQCLTLSPVAIAPARAEVDLWGGNNIANNAFNSIGFSKKDPREIVANIIKILLGFLGTIAVVLIIYAGFLWMTAAGKPDNTKKAKDIMSAAVTGLVIILISYGITVFVTNALSNAIQ
jgi:type IV secretory pathway VirB2 component (pilin)